MTPIVLTLLRIVAIPFFIAAFFLDVSWGRIAAVIIFILAAITDGLDGHLARKQNKTTALGAFLDPVADKLMVTAALVMITTDRIDLWITIPSIIIIGREITISALREWMAKFGSSDSVSVLGISKLKTTIQIIAIIFLLYKDSIFGLPISILGIILLYIAMILTVWSMFIYLKTAWPIFRPDFKSKGEKNES